MINTVMKIKKYIAMALLIGVTVLPVVAYAVAKGYDSADKDIRVGMFVAFTDTANGTTVERASLDNKDRAIGVVIDAEESSVTVSSGTKTVIVESTGQADALVSDLNGSLKTGDLLSLSPLKGVLVKAERGPAVAQVSEDIDFSDAEIVPVTWLDGATEAKVVTAKINLDPKAITAGAASQEADSSLERLGRAVTGKEVSEIRVVLGILLFLMVMLVEGSIIYGAASSAITSMGRNPLAKKFIRGELVRVGFITVGVLAVGLGAVYVILWI